MEPKKGGSARMEDVVAPDAGTWTCEMAALIMKGAVSSVVRGVVLRCAAGSEAPRSDCALRGTYGEIIAHSKNDRRYKNG
jgi:hypothetical protein